MATLAMMGLLAFAPAANAAGVAYVDNGNVQVSSVDGATKAALTSDGGPDRIYGAVAHTGSGKVFASSRTGSSPSVTRFTQYSPLGARLSEFFPGKNTTGPAATFPLGFAVTAAGTNIAYGWSQFFNNPFPMPGTRVRGTWIEPADRTAGSPPFALELHGPTFMGDRVVAVSGSDSDLVVQNAPGAPYGTAFTGWLSFGSGNFLHFVRAIVAPNGTTFAYEAFDAEPEPDDYFMVLGVNSGAIPAGTNEQCVLPKGANPRDVTFSPDSATMAWRDDGGIKVIAVPPVPATGGLPACSTAAPTVISTTGESPALGGIDVPALIASRRAGPPPGPPSPVPPPAPTPDTTRPRFTSAPKFTPSSFRARASGAVLSAAVRGSTLSFSLSEAATITLTVTRTAGGRRVKGACVKPSAANRRKPSCKLAIAVGSISKAVKAGAARLRFSGRMSGKALRSGGYTAKIVARDAAGNTSSPARAKFRILR